MDDGMNPTSSGLRMEQQNIITLLFWPQGEHTTFLIEPKIWELSFIGHLNLFYP
jgi:hypothetical protein